MKTQRIILLLTLAVFLGSCATAPQPPRAGKAPSFRSPAGPAPSLPQSASTTPSETPTGTELTSDAAPYSAQGREVKITGSDSSKTPDAKKEGEKDKKPILPSLKGKFESGLLTLPIKEKKAEQPIPGQEKQKVILNFEKAEIAEVTSQIFGDYLKVNYVLDPTLQGRISLYLEGEFTKDELFQLVTKAYEANNVSIVPRQGMYYIQPVQRSSSSSLPTADSITLQADKEGVRPIIVMYRLRYMDVKQATNTVKFFLSPGRPITSDSLTNSIIFVEDTDNARSIVNVLQALDIDVLQEVSMEIVPLQSIAPQDAVQAMESLVGKLDIFKDSAMKGNLAYIPLQNYGGVLVLAQKPELIKTAKYWLSALDVHSTEAGEQIYVYFAQNGLAIDIADILNQVYGLQGGGGTRRPEQQIVSSTRYSSGTRTGGFGSSSSFGGGGGGMGSTSGSSSFGRSSGISGSGSGLGASSATGGTTGGAASAATGSRSTQARGQLATRIGGQATAIPPGLTAEVIVIPDEVNNAIVIRANSADYAKIKKTIETLDILPRAVLIEVMIAEIALTKDLSYGLQWFLNRGDFSAAFNRTPRTNAAGDATEGLPFRLTDVTGSGLGLLFNSSRDWAVLLKLLASKTDINILATPTLLATDNKEASIMVGGREPVPTGSFDTSGSTAGTSIFSTISYEETGTLLNVTPHINAGGLVRLELDQTIRRTVPGAAGTVTVGANNTAPRFVERNIKSTILAQNGSTVVIGGIIDETQSDVKSGVPFLQDIPILSPLFSTKSRNMNRTELIIAITPHVVNHRESGTTREFLNRLQELKSRMGK